MSEETKNTTAKLSGITLFFFALVGFAASITTIVSFFDNKPESAIKIEVKASPFLVPQYVASYFKEGSSARKMAKDIMQTACKGIDSNKLIYLSDDELMMFKVPGKKYQDVEFCRNAHAMDFLSRWADSYAQDSGTFIRYSIKNVGSDVAKGIRLDSANLNSAQIERNGEYTNLTKSNGSEYYNIPELNPHESTNVYAWAKSSYLSKDLSYTDYDDFPSITYSGYKVDVSLARSITGFWASLANVFNGIPILFQMIFISCISLLYSGFILLIVSILVSVLKGQGFSGAFISAPKPSTDQTINDAKSCLANAK